MEASPAYSHLIPDIVFEYNIGSRNSAEYERLFKQKIKLRSYTCDQSLFNNILPKVGITIDESTHQGNYFIKELPFYFEKNIKTLTSSFNKNVKQRDNYNNNLDLKFDTISQTIAELPFLNGVVELTKSNNLKISLLFPNNILLLLTESGENEVVFSVFINKELIMSDVAKTTEFIEGFRRFLEM